MLCFWFPFTFNKELLYTFIDSLSLSLFLSKCLKLSKRWRKKLSEAIWILIKVRMVMNVHNYERYFSFIIDESRRIYVIFFWTHKSIIARLSQSLWTTPPTNFYNPNQLSTRCLVKHSYPGLFWSGDDITNNSDNCQNLAEKGEKQVF